MKAIVSWKSVLQWAAVLMGVIVLTGLMQIYLDWQYERMEERARLENREVTGISDGSALERYEQIAQGGGESKRKIIWSVAIREYADFSLTEKLTGKGFGYDRLLYQKTDDRELLEAYAPESRSLLSAHCFVLADLLNSGLIGAVLGILVWAAIGVRLLKMLLAGEKGTMFFVITLGITFANNLISNRYGFCTINISGCCLACCDENLCFAQSGGICYNRTAKEDDRYADSDSGTSRQR